MTRDYSKIKLFWGDRLQRLHEDIFDGFDLDANTLHYLTNIGLPKDLKSLNRAIEINFYFQKDRIIKKELGGVNYCIIGDDTGTQFAISIMDNKLYAIDFDNVIGTDSVCFVNSTIDKFIETIQLFMEFQNKTQDEDVQEIELVKLMRTRMKDIDENSIDNQNTWWGTVVNDPIKDW
jgi:hypothetical protein